MQVATLSILGVGLLGGSIGLACKAGAKHCKIIGYGHRASSLQKAMEMGAIDQMTCDPAEAVRQGDLVILCTPVGQFGAILRQISPALKKGAVVTDVGSTKRSVVALAAKILPRTAHFVGSHPMAGSEKRGVDFARADLFANAICLMTPTAKTPPAAIRLVRDFWRSLGMRIVRLTPAEHDRRLADVSHLPHALAAALVAMQDKRCLELAGKGFFDATRIAAGDGGIWRDILLDNRDNMLLAIRQLRQELSHLEKLLDPRRAGALANWLTQAAKRRQDLALKKFRELAPD